MPCRKARQHLEATPGGNAAMASWFLLAVTMSWVRIALLLGPLAGPWRAVIQHPPTECCLRLGKVALPPPAPKMGPNDEGRRLIPDAQGGHPMANDR